MIDVKRALELCDKGIELYSDDFGEDAWSRHQFYTAVSDVGQVMLKSGSHEVLCDFFEETEYAWDFDAPEKQAERERKAKLWLEMVKKDLQSNNLDRYLERLAQKAAAAEAAESDE